MNLAYWNEVNRNYESEILSVWDREQTGCIPHLLNTALQEIPDRSSAADLGCGVGKFLPLLCTQFETVHACDFAQSGLDRARHHCNSGYGHNLRFHCVDLTSDPMPFDPVKLVLCINVLLMPSLDERLRAWRSVCNQVDHGGWLLLGVPSLESMLLEQHLERDSLLQSGLSCEQSLRHTLPAHSSLLELHQGVHRIEGCPTKHYLREELQDLLTSHQLEPIRWERLRYSAAAESGDALWDWCVLSRRIEEV